MPPTNAQLRHILEEALLLSRSYSRQTEGVAVSEKQSRARWEVLTSVGDGRTVPQIARRMGMARQSVQRLVDLLAEDRLVRFEANPQHRRSPILKATEEGTRLRDRLERKMRGWEQTVQDLVDPEDLETALVVLRNLRSAVER